MLAFFNVQFLPSLAFITSRREFRVLQDVRKRKLLFSRLSQVRFNQSIIKSQTMSSIQKARKLFLDCIKIRTQGGRGGTGLAKYGGIGGEGGDVYITGDSNLTTLNGLEKVFVAGDGESSRKSRLVGKKGNNKVVKVPLGVSIIDDKLQFVGEINTISDQVLVACGGRGGDKFNASHGYAGQTRRLLLDLKTISDIGFIGFPNAGKSTLLTKVSRASPKIASYPFTTLRPHIGTVIFNDSRSITMTDLPGLVEGSHKNIGLGFEFLKHVYRARVLAFVVDIDDSDLGPNYPIKSPTDVISILNKEIELYDDIILKKPSILLVSKMDKRPDANQRYESILKQVEELKKNQRIVDFNYTLPISSHSGLNIDKFKNIARELIDECEELKLQESS